MVQSPHIDAAARVALRLVLQRKTQVLGRLVPLRLGVEFDEMAMGIVKPVGGPMPKLLLDPAEIRGLDRLHAPQQGPRAAGAKGGMAESGRLRSRQLKGILLVIVPGTQKDRVVPPAASVMPNMSTKNLRLSSSFGVKSSRWPRCTTSMIGSSTTRFLRSADIVQIKFMLTIDTFAEVTIISRHCSCLTRKASSCLIIFQAAAITRGYKVEWAGRRDFEEVGAQALHKGGTGLRSLQSASPDQSGRTGRRGYRHRHDAVCQ